MIALSGNAQAQDVVEDGQINYLTGDPATWPSELEATVAAPDNHRILLENDRVRVLEVTLGPGEVEPLHFHRWPSVLHILQADQWIDRDADGKVIFDSREVPTIQYPLTIWKGPEAPHSPVNLSDSVTVRLIRVEVKPDQPASAQPDALAQFAQRYAAAWSSQKPEAVAAFYAEDGRLMVNDGEPAVGRAAIADVARGFMDAFPDMVVTFDRLERKGERVLFHWTLTGTNTGAGGTEALVRISGVEAWLVRHKGLIADSVGSFDAEDYARQLAGPEPDAHLKADGNSGMAETGAAKRQIQQTIDTVYAAISGPAGSPRDWNAFSSAFSADARLFTISAEGLRGGSVEEYIALSDKALVSYGFREEELVNRIEVYGKLAQAWSSYEGHFVRDGQPGSLRGINSFQFQRQADGSWRVHSLLWQQETSEFPLPGDMANAARPLIDSAGEAEIQTVLDNRTRVIIEGIRSGDVSQIMVLYGPGSHYSTDNATLLSDPEAIEAFWVNVAASPAHDATLEVLRVERLGPDAFVEIQKYDVFDAAGERLFGGYASLLWRRVEGRWIIAADVSN